MNFINKKILISAVIGTMVLGGCAPKADTTENVDNALSVEAATATMGEVETSYVYSGKTTPVETATVFSLVNGIVDKVNFDIGDNVKAGDVLFSMDTASIQTNLKASKAAHEAAAANVAVAETSAASVNGASMQMQIENAKVSMETAKIAYDTTKTAYDNTKTLFDQGYISQSDMDAATDGLTRAEATYNQAKNAYDLTSGELIAENTKKAQASLQAARANVKSASAQIESSQKMLNDAQVKSPINGVVTGKNVTAGVMLSTGAVPFTVTDSSSVIVKVSVSEQIINLLEKGQSVDVKIAAVSAKKMTGKIKTINPAANTAGTYDIEIEIPNATGVVKVGMFAEVSFTKAKAYNAIVVTRDAVISKNNENYVFVVEDGVAVKKEVVMGVDDGKVVQLLKGVEEGDLVIVKGQSYLEDANKVEVVVLDGAKIDEADQDTTKGE